MAARLKQSKGSVKIDWKLVTSLGGDLQATGFLSGPARRLPDSGPLHELLVRAKELLNTPSNEKPFTSDQAAAAVNSGAVSVLAKLLHQLQQDPSTDNHLSASAATLHGSLWFWVLNTLLKITSQQLEGSTGKYCVKQLQEAAGKRNVAI